MNPTRDVTVIIPAAGQISESLVALSGRFSAAMTPLNGKPVIYWTLSYLEQLGFSKIVVAVRTHDSAVEEFVSRVFQDKLDVRFVIPDRDGGVGYTVLACQSMVQTRQVLIVLGDTFFKFPDAVSWESSPSFVLVADVKESYRWCLVEKDMDDKIKGFVDKPRDYIGPMKALVGVYALTDWPFFVECLNEAWAHAPDRPLEISAGLSRYLSRGLMAYLCVEWYDCGNPDNLMRARRRLLQTREFNRIDFDEIAGTITKRSRNTDKLVDEIQYYRLLPDDLQVFFPRIISSSPHGREPFLTMEFYGYPTLAESFVFENLSHHIWRQIFEHLAAIVGKFGNYHKPGKADYFDYMYRQRVDERIESLRQSKTPVAHLINDFEDLIVNGKPYQNFRKIWPEVQRLLPKLARETDFSIIHGDLCFSNILYDLNGRVCKLLDPRGSFGQRGVYGDIKYDIAKLYHSVHGLYDYVTNDLFSYEARDNKVDFKVYAPSEVEKIRQAFDAVFFERFDRSEILLIEGLQFVTMGVFHYDFPERQLAMYTTGVMMWNEVLQNENLS